MKLYPTARILLILLRVIFLYLQRRLYYFGVFKNNEVCEKVRARSWYRLLNKETVIRRYKYTEGQGRGREQMLVVSTDVASLPTSRRAFIVYYRDLAQLQKAFTCQTLQLQILMTRSLFQTPNAMFTLGQPQRTRFTLRLLMSAMLTVQAKSQFT